MVATEPTESIAQFSPGWPDEIVRADVRVPTLDGSLRRYINLDNAASTPPTSVPGAVRASIGIHTTPADLDIFFEALRAIVGGRFSDAYQVDASSGEYTPVGWNPSYSTYFSV